HLLGILMMFKEHIENFSNIRTLNISVEDRQLVSDLEFLTEKPMIYICNVDESSAVKGNQYVDMVIEKLQGEKAEILVIAAASEAEIADLESVDERNEFLNYLGLEEPGVNKLVRAAYRLLKLRSFFTIGPKEIRAWTIREGMNAQQAAGVIHSDLERGFIRAEVIKYDDFISLKSESACKDKGKLRLEGKGYIVDDGDLMHIRFNV
ncbi:MAG: DUF933 domain-containing protein, partial [Bacteroidota bacterium]